MVMEAVAAAGLVLGVLAVVGIFFVLARLRTISANNSFAQLTERLNSVADSLDEKIIQTRSDIAGRLQQVKGDLSLESADRLSGGFLGLKTALEHQLSAGRQELAMQLKLEISTLTAENRISMDAIRTDVDQKLAAISNSVQVKLDQNIKDGFAQFEKVQQHLSEAQEQLKNLGVIGESINDLNNLLKMPHLRGRFGEQGLERLLEDFLPRHMLRPAGVAHRRRCEPRRCGDQVSRSRASDRREISARASAGAFRNQQSASPRRSAG